MTPEHAQTAFQGNLGDQEAQHSSSGCSVPLRLRVLVQNLEDPELHIQFGRKAGPSCPRGGGGHLPGGGARLQETALCQDPLPDQP